MPRSRSLSIHLYALVAPSLTFLCILGMTIVLVRTSRMLIEDDLARAGEEECRKVVNLLDAALRERMMAMTSMARYVTYNRDISEAEFAGYGESVMQNFSGILAIAVTDRRLKPIFSKRGRPISQSQLQSLLRPGVLAGAAGKVRDTGLYAVTDPFEVPGYGPGFAVLAPYDRGEELGGFVVGVFLYDMVDWLLPPDLFRFNVQLSHGDTRIPASPLYPRFGSEGALAGEVGDRAVVRDNIILGSQIWEVQVTPIGYGKSSRLSFPSVIILMMGTILGLIVGMILYRQQIVASESKHVARTTQSRLASTSDRLANVKGQLDLILNNVDEGIILYDEELKPLQANEAFKREFGSAEDSSRLEPEAEEHHRAMAGRFQNESQYWGLLNTLRENSEKPLSDEIEVRQSGGRSQYFQRRATAVCAPDGRRLGYLLIYQDTTSKRTVERLKEDFLSNVTHDLRTPVAAIKGFAETMLRDGKMDQATRDEFSQIISDESGRLQEMIEDLLDVRRMEDGRSDLALATYDMKGLVEDVVRSSKPILDTHEIKVEVQWEGERPRPLPGDVAKISRAIRNILNNSIKYSPARSSIDIRGLEGPDRVEVEFTDEGPGIPAEEIQHVFEKFYRGARHTRRTQGTGLGLAIVKHIIESHGGVVSAANAPGRGATIKIVLPREHEYGLNPLGEPLRSAAGGVEQALKFN